MPGLPTLDAWRDRGRHLTVFGRDIFVVDTAAVEPSCTDLVILHGYPSSSHDFAHVLGRLSARRRVVVHDHLGFGLSAKPTDEAYSITEQAEVALAVWRELGITRAHLLTHDYGASVGTELMARRERLGLPIEFASLTLTNASVHMELANPRLIQWMLRNPRTGPIVARLAKESTFSRNMRATCGDPSAVDDDEIATMWALITHGGGRDVLPVISRYLDERTRFSKRWIGALTRLDLPAHVLWGNEDPVARVAVAEMLVGEIPSVTHTPLPGRGHYAMIEAPEEWADAALAFLDEHEG